MRLSTHVVGNAVLIGAVVLSYSLNHGISQVAQVKHSLSIPALDVSQVLRYENHPQMEVHALVWAYPLDNDTTAGQSVSEADEVEKLINNDDKAIQKSYMNTTDEPEECTDFDEDDDESQFWNCEECGGFQSDFVARMKRCKGIPENNYKWKDCFCQPEIKESPYVIPDNPTTEEIRNVLTNLPKWTNASYADETGPPLEEEDEEDSKRDVIDEKKSLSDEEK